MSKKKWWLLAVILCTLVLIAFTVAGCGGNDAEPPDNGDPNGDDDPDEVWPSSLILGSASIGGTYYVYGGGIATLISEKIDGVVCASEETGGPNHNILLIHQGDIDLGMATMGPAWEGWNGVGDWTGGVKQDNIRAIFPMYNSYVFVWAPVKDNITSVADLKDVRRMGVGPTGGTPGTYWPRFLELWGFDTEPVWAGYSDLASQQIDGLIGPIGNIIGVPVAAVNESAAQMDIVKFGVDGEYREAAMKEWPFFSPAVIPAGTYEWMDYDVDTMGIYNFAICHKDLPESLVYEIVKTIMENNDSMVTTHSAAKETLPENFVHNTFLPYHPGAIRYFEEKGFTIDPSLYPPEYKK